MNTVYRSKCARTLIQTRSHDLASDSKSSIWTTLAPFLSTSLWGTRDHVSYFLKKNISLPELHQNPLVQRVIEIFDQDGNGEVDFKEFIEGVSQFSVKGDKDSKLKCKIFSRFRPFGFIKSPFKSMTWTKTASSRTESSFRCWKWWSEQISKVNSSLESITRI